MGLGAGGVGGSQAHQQADSSLGRLCGLSLVPRDGARKFRGRRHRAGDERVVRQHQGRPRGAARHRSDLHGGAASSGRAGRLAADHVSDARRRADLGRHLFSQFVALRQTGFCRRAARSRAAVPRGAAEDRAQPRRADGAARRRTARKPGTVTIGVAELDNAARQLGGIIDPVNGGTRGAPKFPQAALFELLWRAGLAHRRTALFCRRRDHARPHLRRRHIRSSRRRLFPLLGRRALAHAAFRENALRQRPAPRTIGHRIPALRQAALPAARARDRRLAHARNDDRRGRVLGVARRRFRGRRGKILRLVLRRSDAAARQRRRRILRTPLRRDAGRQFRRPQHSQPARTAAAQRCRRGAARRVTGKTSCRARGARAPRPRRQSARRLERTDDRGARQCEPDARRTVVARHGRARLRLHRRHHDPRRSAWPFLARRPAQISRPRVGFRGDDPRRAGALRGDRSSKTTSIRRSPGSTRSIATTPTRKLEPTISPPPTPRAW